MADVLVLLRGVNVGGRNKLLMADLCALATELGYDNPRTYIQSGNLLIDTDDDVAMVQAMLQAGLAEQLGLSVSVVARTAAQWRAYIAAAPWPEARAERGKLVHLCLPQAPLRAGAAEALTGRAQGGERVQATADALWVDFAGGVGRSKLTPKVIDRAAGSPVTARNWRSVVALGELLG